VSQALEIGTRRSVRLGWTQLQIAGNSSTRSICCAGSTSGGVYNCGSKTLSAALVRMRSGSCRKVRRCAAAVTD
jgi:hypothetical protein